MKRKMTAGSKLRVKQKRKLIFLLFAFFALICFLCYGYLFYTTSSYFAVKKVLLIGGTRSSGVDYGAIKRMTCGRNIFKVNLKDIERYMLDNYRELKDIRLRRAFPDSILVTAVLRRPIVQLLQELYYPVDAECVVLPDAKEVPGRNLPVVSGITVNLRRAVGKKIDSQSLRQALILFEFIRESGILSSHTLSEINAGNIKGMSFILDGSIEIRIGHEDYANRLKDVRDILQDPKIWPSDIGYIDLRFGEPVIGPKWKR